MNYGDEAFDIRDSARPFALDEIKSFGRTLVLAPHPDDESLGCGGTIALLTSLGNDVHVVFVSDGSMSHPGSQKFPANLLKKLREKEALEALAHLKVPASKVIFMGLKDAALPSSGLPGFEEAVKAVSIHLENIQPDTVLLPWRRDTHADHRACWQQFNEAAQLFNKNMLVLEYPLWLWERGSFEEMPTKKEVEIRSVDISDWVRKKQLAIACHQSQVTRMINDDPEGFTLSPGVLAHFKGPKEIFMVHYNQTK